jgi:hypothetical protein
MKNIDDKIEMTIINEDIMIEDEMKDIKLTDEDIRDEIEETIFKLYKH